MLAQHGNNLQSASKKVAVAVAFLMRRHQRVNPFCPQIVVSQWALSLCNPSRRNTTVKNGKRVSWSGAHLQIQRSKGIGVNPVQFQVQCLFHLTSHVSFFNFARGRPAREILSCLA